MYPTPQSERTLSLDLPSGSVPIRIAWNADFGHLADRDLAPLQPDHVGILSDSHVFIFYGAPLEAALQERGYQVRSIVLEPGEATKTLDVADSVYGRLAETGFSRRSILLALGGGVVGDLCGFVASTFMRGIRYIQIPTSLVGQVDSSLGGKTAINHWAGKNLIGSFYNPQAVWVDPYMLDTLPEAEFHNGFGEIIKYGATLSPWIHQSLTRHPGIASVRSSPVLLEELIYHCIEAKIRIVCQDEREAGLRKVLNFGHTYGHALEAASRYGMLRHGEAVGWGMIFAQRLGVRLGLVDPSWENELETTIRRFLELPSLDSLHVSDIEPFLRTDKKNSFGKIFFIFSTGPGRYLFHPETDYQAVLEAAQEFLTND